jgi:hypothetical protein
LWLWRALSGVAPALPAAAPAAAAAVLTSPGGAAIVNLSPVKINVKGNCVPFEKSHYQDSNSGCNGNRRQSKPTVRAWLSKEI